MDLVITVSADDPSDIDFIRTKAVAVVEELVVDNEERFDGPVEVSWEMQD